ncbi:nudix hydrolase 19, chloroplastic [Cocos nucifera]|nr:nudix hydrolase 19, chloroplastic [Cocos nucifera]
MFLPPPQTLILRLRGPLRKTLTRGPRISPAMSVNLQTHAFAGNPLRSKLARPAGPCSPGSAFETLKSLLAAGADEGSFKVLAFRKGRPLARSLELVSDTAPKWRLGWVSPSKFKNSSVDDFVYLGPGSEGDADTVYWAIDVSSSPSGVGLGGGGDDGLCFVELRTLMVATDWADTHTMGELAIAGHARAILEWHSVSRFCGHCGTSTVPIEAGRRKQCTNESCKKRIYPRVDPVVIMLVIDKANDRALLSRQSRFVPRMWSCLAGFIEPGESLEEAVRRETWEETGIEVGEVVYHSSQPWPVGPNSMPCQLMVGFFAYAKSFEIHVDKAELEDAKWHSREDVRKALTFAEYEKAQRTAAFKVNQMCKGVEKGQNFSLDFNVESGELAQMFIPGPFAIAHHLISSWVHEGAPGIAELLPKQLNSVSSL